jgi:hypothetical protein
MALDLKIPLRDLLSAVTGGDHTHLHIAELNRLCQRMALTYIRRGIAAGKVNPSFLGLTDRDISADCVAQLFSPSPDGRFVEFIEYFDRHSVDILNTPERMLLVHLRRLVFYLCNDNIFRMYGEADPSLSRIIRNIKLGMKRSGSIGVVMKFDEQLIVPRTINGEMPLQVMAYDELQRLVDGTLNVRRGIPAVLEGIARYFQEKSSPGNVIPLTNLACCVREGFMRLNIPDAAEDPDPMFIDDIRTIVREACDHVGSSVGSKYLVRGKICREKLEGYMAAIRELLEAEFLGRTDGDLHYFDYFSAALPEISREEYAGTHRPVFEYLAKLTRTRACRDLREL